MISINEILLAALIALLVVGGVLVWTLDGGSEYDRDENAR